MATNTNSMLFVPWSSGSREIACRRCRIRKKRCDKKRPTCQECAKAGAECQPLKPKKVNHTRDAQTDYVHLLEDHIASLESRLRQSHPGIAEDHLSPVLRRRSSVAPTPENDTPALHDGGMVVHRGELPVDETWAMDQMDDVCFGQDYSNTTPLSPTLLLDLGDFNPQPRSPRQPQIDLGSAALSHRHVAIAAADMYASEYFRNAHPMWPFLHSKQWDECWGAWQSPHSTSTQDAGGWTTFLVDMVLSIGALLTQNSDPAPEHLESFKHLQAKALRQYESHATQTWPAILRTQSSLLLTIQAIHSDSIDTLRTRASEAMMNCTLSKIHMDDAKKKRARARAARNGGRPPRDDDDDNNDNDDGVEDEMQRQTVRSCYIIDIIVSSSTNQSVSFVDSSVEDGLLGEPGRDPFPASPAPSATSPISSSPSSSSSSSPPSGGGCCSPGGGTALSAAAGSRTMVEDQVFQLRRIQYRILKMVQRLEYEAERDGHPVPNLWRSHMRHDIARWTRDVTMGASDGHHHHHHHHHSNNNVNGRSGGSVGGRDRQQRQQQDHQTTEEKRFTSQAWLLKLANYAIISLFPNPRLAVRSGDARHLVAACCEVLVTFRRLRIKEHITCYTWTALIHQFTASLTLLHCLWLTPPPRQPVLYCPRQVSRALLAASATLSDYAVRWPATAAALRDVFDLVAHEMPAAEFGGGPAGQSWDGCAVDPGKRRELRRLCGELGRLRVRREVVAMVEEMAKGAGRGRSGVWRGGDGGGGAGVGGEEEEEEMRWMQFVVLGDEDER